jgi:hypothetical protein
MRAYGATGSAIDSIFRFTREVNRSSVFDQWVWPKLPPDSSAARARSEVATGFLRSGDDVMVMVDSDVLCAEGDIEYVAAAALESKGLVGAVVSKKAPGQGFGGRFNDGKVHELYSDEIVKLEKHQYLGGALIAFHKSVLREMVKKSIVHYCPLQGFWPFFCEDVIKNEELGCHEHLSEDWAFCHRAQEAGKPVLALMRPVTVHEGRALFTALEGNCAIPTEEVAND